MNTIEISSQAGQPRHILFLGAHCDDIEIGCGGAVLSMLEQQPDTQITWVVFCSDNVRKAEAEAGFKALTQRAEAADLRIFEFRDGYLPNEWAAVKDCLEVVKKDIDKPDLIFTHYRHDLHQDHRLVNELTWNTFRDHLVLEYEIPKWDGKFLTEVV